MDLIPEMFFICLKYLETHGLKINWDTLKYEESIDNSYNSQFYYAIKNYNIDLGENKKFLNLNIPQLLNDSFFKLNGSTYVPILRISDYPITIKKNSILLYSLFKSITIFFKDSRVIFCGHNIEISKFFRLFFDSDETKNICLNIFKCKYIDFNIDDIYLYFSKLFNCEIDTVLEKMNSLFFDLWTSELYKKCYKCNPDLNEVIKLCINNKNPSVIDLNFKRLMFIEHLLKPLLNTITSIISMLENGKEITRIPIDFISIVDYFFRDNGLQSNVFYDIPNSYNGLLSLKATFKSPGAEKNLPSEISSIHDTFKSKICPVTISSKKAGEVISLVPNQNIDLKFGLWEL